MATAPELICISRSHTPSWFPALDWEKEPLASFLLRMPESPAIGSADFSSLGNRVTEGKSGMNKAFGAHGAMTPQSMVIYTCNWEAKAGAAGHGLQGRPSASKQTTER